MAITEGARRDCPVHSWQLIEGRCSSEISEYTRRRTPRTLSDVEMVPMEVLAGAKLRFTFAASLATYRCRMNIELISAEQTIDLRHRVLRAHQPRSACVYPGDDAHDSFHVGAVEAGQIQCIASFFRQDAPYCAASSVFRLRGMATAPAFRGQGLGTKVLKAGCEQARSLGASEIWCNARVGALGFYIPQGFVKVSDEFEIEGIGPHFVLAKKL